MSLKTVSYDGWILPYHVRFVDAFYRRGVTKRNGVNCPPYKHESGLEMLQPVGYGLFVRVEYTNHKPECI